MDEKIAAGCRAPSPSLRLPASRNRDSYRFYCRVDKILCRWQFEQCPGESRRGSWDQLRVEQLGYGESAERGRGAAKDPRAASSI